MTEFVCHHCRTSNLFHVRIDGDAITVICAECGGMVIGGQLFARPQAREQQAPACMLPLVKEIMNALSEPPSAPVLDPKVGDIVHLGDEAGRIVRVTSEDVSVESRSYDTEVVVKLAKLRRLGSQITGGAERPIWRIR